MASEAATELQQPSSSQKSGPRMSMIECVSGFVWNRLLVPKTGFGIWGLSISRVNSGALSSKWTLNVTTKTGTTCRLALLREGERQSERLSEGGGEGA